MKELRAGQAGPEPKGDRSDWPALVALPLLPREERAWDESMATHHLGFRQPAGEPVQCGAGRQGGGLVGVAGGRTGLWAPGPVECPERRWQRLRWVANQRRCRVLPGLRVRNLASRVLEDNLRRLASVGLAGFGHPVLLAETLVEHRRLAGTC